MNKKCLICKAIQILKNDGFLVLLLKTQNYILCVLFNIITIPYLMFNRTNLKQFSSTDPKEIFTFISNKFFHLLEPIQIQEEFVALLDIFKEKNPQVIMEIGTAKGGTLFSFCKLAGEDAIIISIDLPKGLYGDYPKWRTQIYKAFAKGKQKLYLLRRDSHQQETLEEVKKILNGKLINFLFIDADHSYDGVKKDYEMYGSLVKQGGIIAFHDIVKSPPEMQCFVYDFWEEIKKRYIYKEIIKDKNQNWRGIGILFI